jgi:hypothetical protein
MNLLFGWSCRLRFRACRCAGQFDSAVSRQLKITKSHHNILCYFGAVSETVSEKKHRMPIKHGLYCFGEALFSRLHRIALATAIIAQTARIQSKGNLCWV